MTRFSTSRTWRMAAFKIRFLPIRNWIANFKFGSTPASCSFEVSSSKVVLKLERAMAKSPATHLQVAKSSQSNPPPCLEGAEVAKEEAGSGGVRAGGDEGTRGERAGDEELSPSRSLSQAAIMMRAAAISRSSIKTLNSESDNSLLLLMSLSWSLLSLSMPPWRLALNPPWPSTSERPSRRTVTSTSAPVSTSPNDRNRSNRQSSNVGSTGFPEGPCAPERKAPACNRPGSNLRDTASWG
mmetsp:Transcript_2537/g.3840  ORF Transcript_2537/g.3840 Transcript_2537/m.3840 type:complete len:240 (+) Transcript_2537:1675-2394(+)